MKLKDLIKLEEEIGLETAFEHPAVLWIQGLNEKEYNFFLNLITNYNRNYILKKLSKKLDMTNNLFSELEELYRKIILSFFKDNDKIIQKGYENNFGRLGINISISGERDKIVKKAFDLIRN